LVPEIRVRHSYQEAVDLVLEALAPLGEEYVATLRSGLLGGWVDRYENKGKRSGAFSAGSYVGDPYILLNYKEDVLRDVFTLAHEAGHSMHSYYSSKNNPFQHYDYTIFEAEVASTFNEQLLNRHLLEKAKEPRMQAYLINKELDDLVATLFRQTMFAEFEDRAHKHVEEGNPATLDYFRQTYGELLKDYFGPDVSIDEAVELEGLRIPHFYRAFYVYKYSTGISAAISLSKRVLSGGKKELDDYFSFLKSGGSRFPLESLGAAGVDMSKPEPIQEAMSHFASRLEQLEGLLEEKG
jgi:oligoendopeptidase F